MNEKPQLLPLLLKALDEVSAGYTKHALITLNEAIELLGKVGESAETMPQLFEYIGRVRTNLIEREHHS